MERLDKYILVGVLAAAFAATVVIITPMRKYTMQAAQYRIARPTNNLPEIIKFYHDGLGLEKVGGFWDHQGFDGVMFGLPDQMHHLEFTQQRGVDADLPEPTKDHLLVFYFDDPEKYFAANERLQQIMNIKPVESGNPYWTGKGETYEDPDRWRVVLFNGHYEP